MAFLAPAVLAGAAAIAAPIAIHLLNKTKVKVVRWAAIRFLAESLKKNQRRLQVEDLVLLLLRCLFIILLALAFARLVLNPGGSQGSASSTPTVAVLLVDQSGSMGQSDGFRTRFEQARDAAGKVIDGLAPGSQVALFLVGNRVNQVIPRPIPNLPFARRTLSVATVTDQSSDLTSALQLAVEALKPFSSSRREIDVFTDGQASAMPDADQVAKLLADAPDVKLNFVDLGAKTGEDNLAITSLKPESGVPAAGQLTGFLIDISNYGQAAASGLRVTLSVDDGPPVDETVLEDLPAGATRTVRLNARFPKPGYYTLRAAIPADRMPVDNERAAAVHVIDHMNVSVVEGGAAKKGERREGFFLANALAPVSPSRRADYYLKVDTQPVSWLATADLSHQEAVFLCDVPKLDAASAKNLEKYVREGGSLVIFPGPLVQPAAYNDDSILAPMLPAKLGPLNDSAHGGKSLSWQLRNYGHPVTALWNDPKVGSLGSVRASTSFPLQLVTPKDQASAPRVLVKYTDDSPAAVESTYGQGHVVLFSSSATTDWTNLPIHPNFVPFLQRLVGYLSPDSVEGSLAVTPGTVIQAKVPADLISREVSAITPASHGKPRSVGKVELINKDTVVRYRDTAHTGAYRFFVAGQEEPVAAFAVQMDAKESDLQMLPADRFAALSSKEKVAGQDSVAVAVAPATKVRRELWVVFLCAALVVALLEMVLAHRFSFAK